MGGMMLSMRRFSVALVLSVSLGTAVAAQAPSNVASAALSDPAASAPANPGDDLGYRLGAGDKVRVIVYGESDLTGEFDVPGGAGVIAFPLVGDVQAGGHTVGELQGQIEAKLRDGYLKDPHVSIEVLNYRPFYILGEVTKPGEYPYTNGLTVLNAVATANGFTYRANTKEVFIKRASEPAEHEYPLTSATPVAPGDTIRIKERFF
jgi:protein involved in polysaccharide export with SLBB domain